MDNVIKWILVIMGVSIVALGGLVYFNSKPAAGTADISKVKTDGEPFVGQTTAPVTIAYWSDYQCIYCRQFETNVLGKLYDDYVATGKVKIVFKDYAFLGPDSTTASLIARAVWQAAPDKFYDWRKAMFVQQGVENGGWASKENILTITKNAGIDPATISSLLDVHTADYQTAIDTDKQEGTLMGVESTPSFIVGKQLLIGVQSYDDLKKIIDAQLK